MVMFYTYIIMTLLNQHPWIEYDTSKWVDTLYCFFMLLMQCKWFILLKSECTHERFWMACIERCSGHCVNNETCDHVNGVCLNGCYMTSVKYYAFESNSAIKFALKTLL